MKYGHLLKYTLLAVSLSVFAHNAYAVHAQSETNAESITLTPQTIQAADPFLESNKHKPGVVSLSDGLQYKILEEGNGPKPLLTDTVIVDYAGTLPDGTEFDSSYKRGEPATFPVAAVIAGWTEALQMMKTGSTWELYIPANLAYGEQGAPPAIGPNQTLVFKVHLVGIKK